MSLGLIATRTGELFMQMRLVLSIRYVHFSSFQGTKIPWDLATGINFQIELKNESYNLESNFHGETKRPTHYVVEVIVFVMENILFIVANIVYTEFFVKCG